MKLIRVELYRSFPLARPDCVFPETPSSDSVLRETDQKFETQTHYCLQQFSIRIYKCCVHWSN